jgi:xylulokinase
MTVIILNMGLKSIRSAVFTSGGSLLSFAARPLETSLNDEILTQDPVEWWEKAADVVRESLSGLRGITVDYISVTSSSSCLVYVDSDGHHLDKCIMVSDKRAKAEARELEELALFEPVRKETHMNADPSLMLPKILWVRNHQPELYARTYKFLSPNDYLIGRMTGRYVTDYFNAQKYHYLMDKQTYPTNLLAELGISPDLLPEIVPPGSLAGELIDSVSRELGIPKQAKPVKVIVSSYDAICSFFGSGVTEEGDASDVSGTVTVFRVLSKRDDLQPSNKIFPMSFRDWGVNVVGGSNNLGGGLIEWVKQCYYHNEPYPYEILEKDARESSIGAGGLIFLPYLLGERAPLWDPDARGAFWGIERFHTRREMTRAVLESTGFIALDMLRSIEETGLTVGDIRFSGGLSRLNLVSQIKADVTGRKILVLSEFETTSVGAAILALVGQKVIPDWKEAVDRFVSVRMVIHPDRKNHEKYREIFKLYKELYTTTKDMFAKRMYLLKNVLERHETTIENM